MAQLRDAQTSALIAEGTPLELALVAEQLTDPVLFDDVGEAFDPVAVIAAHRANIAGLEASIADTPADAEQRPNLEAALTDAQAADDHVAELEAEARGGLTAAEAALAARARERQ